LAPSVGYPVVFVREGSVIDPDTSASQQPAADGHGDDVVTIEVGGRTFILVGTAHVSRESADLVREVVERERPDRVCVELDAQRYEALSRKTQWENLDLKQVIRKRQLATLLVNLLLASYQEKLGGKLGVKPGAELLGAIRIAEELEIPHTLCDRNIRITLLRAWRSMGLVQKWKLLSAILAGVFTETELTEDDLRRLRQQDVLSEMMQELAEYMPRLKSVLIDERDAYMAETIRASEGDRVVAVVGAGHLEGIRKALEAGTTSSVEELETLPPASSAGNWIGWGVPAAIVAAIVWIGFTKGVDVAGDNLQFWILANGIPAAIGATVALAHPLTIAAAFLGAPITSLTPVIGAGYVTAAVQAWMQPPLVRDFQSLSDDAAHVRRWWSNRLLKVLLAFVLPTLGSLLGTGLGGARILRDLF
jgi:pheromone shutdown-related protein TraB